MSAASDRAVLVQCLVARGCPGNLAEIQCTAEVLLQNGVRNASILPMTNFDDIVGLEACSKATKQFLKAIFNCANKGFEANASNKVVRKGKFEHAGPCVSAGAALEILQRMHLKQSVRVRAGPMNEIHRVALNTLSLAEGTEWAENARIEALCNSCVRSMGGIVSAVRCWQAFCKQILKLPRDNELPPTANGLVVWSRMFRNNGTYVNYANGVKLACLIGGVPIHALHHPAVVRAKRGVTTMQTEPKPKRYIRQSLLKDLVKLADDAHARIESLAYILSYAFLLRVPSECLPIIVGPVESGNEPLAAGSHSRLSITKSKLVLQLARRKNKPFGTTLLRSCWCLTCKTTCPVHRAMPFLNDKMWHGQSLFRGLTPFDFVEGLRARLALLKIKDPSNYGSHDFRRGHAVDMQLGGRSLAEILRAGEWSSPAFTKYIDIVSLEAGACLEAHLDESDEESMDDPGSRKRRLVIL